MLEWLPSGSAALSVILSLSFQYSQELSMLLFVLFYVVVIVDVWVYVTIKTPSMPSVSCSRNFILNCMRMKNLL